MYSMPSELSTSVMKSPPLEVWLTGSLAGAMVSAAICRGPGSAAFNFSAGATGMALAAGVVTAAAAPTRLAPLRKLRRLESGDWRRFDMASSQGWLERPENSADSYVDSRLRHAASQAWSATRLT